MGVYSSPEDADGRGLGLPGRKSGKEGRVEIMGDLDSPEASVSAEEIYGIFQFSSRS